MRYYMQNIQYSVWHRITIENVSSVTQGKEEISGLQPKLRPWHILLIFLRIFCHLSLLNFQYTLSKSVPLLKNPTSLYDIASYFTEKIEIIKNETPEYPAPIPIIFLGSFLSLQKLILQQLILPVIWRQFLSSIQRSGLVLPHLPLLPLSLCKHAQISAILQKSRQNTIAP